jgi:PKD repeat protein
VTIDVVFVPNFAPTAAFTFVCDELDCSFDATGSSDSDGAIVTYDWDFGDGTVRPNGGSFPDYSFTADGDYTVTLTVTDDQGGTDSVGQLVGVVNLRIPPQAAFSTSCDGLVCTFDASGSTDSDGLIVSFVWDFDDGDTALEAIPENNFPFPGDYDVQLTVTDDDGDTGTVSQIVTVDIPPTPSPAIPPDVPRANTPYIDAAEITDLEYIGDRVYVVGAFSSLRNNDANGEIIDQGQVAAFDIDTGQVDTTFNPSFGGGGVTEIARNPDGSRLYVVGRFESVNGNSKLRVAAIDPITGDTISSFTADTNSAATSVAVTGDTVYLGGQFSTVNGQPRLGLAAVDAATGELRDDFRVDLTGGQGVNGMITVQALVLTDDLTRLLVVNTAREMDGRPRWGIGLIDTTTNDLLPWRTRLFEENLSRIGGIQRLYAADIAPNGEYFVVGSGSGGDRPPISDTAIAFPLDGGDFVEPLWISRMFDSVYSIAISDDAVYVGGHMNYVESPTAPDPWPGLTTQGYGRGQGLSGYGLGDDVVIRDHIAAIDPAEGKAIEWNPGSNSFEGNKAMLAMPRGIVTAGDGRIQGDRNVGSIAFYDVDELEIPGPNDTKILYPIEGRIETADEEFIVGGTATAVSGIDRVQLEVRDMDTGQYLQDDLTTWGGWNAIITPLMEPGATETIWTQPLVISGNRRIRFLARAFGEDGTADAVKDQQKIETFGLSDATPGTSISGPDGIVSETTFTVTGTASDDIGISLIRMSVRDAQNRYLQDDGTVNDIFNTLTTFPDVIGAPEATWSYELTVPYEGEWTMEAIAVDTSGQSDLRGSRETWRVDTNAVPPEVAILTPVPVNPPFDVVYTVEPGQPMTLTGSAIDDEGLRFVEIRVRNRITDENLTAAGEWGIGLSRNWHRISPIDISGTSYDWSYTTPFTLEQGRYEFEVRAEDDSGLITSSTYEAELDVDVEIPGDSPPDARLDVTGTVTDVQVLHLDVTGTATDDIGVADVLFEVYNRDLRLYVQQDGTLGVARTRISGTVLDLTDPTSVTWSYSVDLPEEGTYDVIAYGIDTSGQLDTSQSGASARYVVYPNDDPPVVSENLLSPVDGTLFTEGRIAISGRVEDDIQIAEVEVAVVDVDGLYMRSDGSFSSGSSWRNAFINSPGSPGSNFSYTTPVIPDGDYIVLVRGVDHHGFVTDPPAERTASVTSPPNDPPIAAFTYSCDENVCTFDARSSTDENPQTLTYSWSFGNGGGSGPVPERTYTSPGSYTVELTVEDEWGAEALATQDIEIVTPAGNIPPVPEIYAPPCNLLTCNFSSLGSTDPNPGDTFTRLWDFGDGGTSTSSATSHTYEAPGTYTVTLTLTDGWGAQASMSIQVSFVVPGDNVAPFPVIETPLCTGLSCDFSSINSFDPNTGDTFTRVWDFGDTAGTSSSISPTYAFAATGTYTVTLTVTDVWLFAASTTVDVTVTEP